MEEELSGKIYDGQIMRRLFRYLAPYKKAVLASVLLLLANSVVQVIGPLLTKTAIDRYLVPSAETPVTPIDRWLPADPWMGLAVLSGIYFTALFLGMIFEFTQTFLMTWTGQKAMFGLRKEVFGHLQKLDISFFDRSPIGRLVTRVTTDIDVLNELFSSGLVTILGDLLMLTFVIVAMFQLSPGMTLLLLAILPVVLWVTIIFRKSVSISYQQTRIAIAKINSYLQEHIHGIAVLQLFNREDKSMEEFRQINAEHKDAFKDSIFAYGWFYPVVEFLSMLALASLLAYGGFKAEQGEVTLGIVVAFFQYGLRFFRPIQDLSEKYNILQSAMAASERVLKLLDTKPSIVSPQNEKDLPPQKLGIEFDQVSFAYKHEEWVLKNVSFQIAPGETVAVVGHTGAGKTTLMSLLMRFYDIQSGSIRIGGMDIRNLRLESLRSVFGVVLQDPYLFTGTLAENIRLGSESIPEEKMRWAARQVNLLDYIESLPEQFNHPIRERGAGLSTGQKQLVSFARALVHDPQILILDEATSSVDTETETRIRAALDHLVTGRTSIIIAHRLSTIQRADRILVMHKGELREMGTHQELLAMRGIYYKLYELQYKEQEKKEALPKERLSSLDTAESA